MTDEAGQYTHLKDEFAEHGVVGHGKGEYVRGDIHTNTLEGYFSVFKRGMKGVYQHCAEKHLHRYLAEFDFRTTIVLLVASTTKRGPQKRWRALSASALPIKRLIQK